MRASRIVWRWWPAIFAIVLLGCSSAANPGSGPAGDAKAGTSFLGYSFPLSAGNYTILGILTDNKDHAQAKSNAEDTITRHPDVACMVGLWAYNPPQILAAVQAVGKEGQIKVVAFDEDDLTLQGIADGNIQGTIIQQPYAFGYKSVEYLSALARGQEVKVPASKMIYIPFTVVRQENVDEFQTNKQNMLAGTGTPPAHDRDDYDTTQPVKVAFLTNSVDPFWTLAERGCQRAAPMFNAQCTVYMPPKGLVQEQKEFIELQITSQCQGLAISPIDPDNQTEMIDAACAAMPVICQDSDAPNTGRKFYIGTSNYMAGRAAGKLVKRAIPAGKVMIFVGKMEVLNAQERSQGLIDELMDKPLPAEFADQAGVLEGI